ncbi:MAG TPA: YceI family protein [Myxococcaceae bacterium]|nr:YceI family protein [Myxococcaceae bacterium]
MKLSLKSAVAALVLAAPSLAFGAEYVFDASHSNAQFSVRHMMVTNVRGEFPKMTGSVNLDEKDVTKSSVEATIDVASINTREPKRDDHLRSPDFFDVAKFPSMTFKSTKVEKAGKDKLKVTGNLTIHGVTKSVVLDVEGPTPEIKDPWGNTKRGLVATTRISRKDFGMTWNKALEAGGVVVGDDVNITIDVEMNKKQPAEAKK